MLFLIKKYLLMSLPKYYINGIVKREKNSKAIWIPKVYILRNK